MTQMKLKPKTLSKLIFLSMSSALLLACTTAPSNDVLASKNRSSSVFVEGVPGGAYSEIDTITATVTAIDYKTRSVTLKDAQGNKRTMIAAADVSNLEQVKVGDQVKIVAALETLMYLPERGQTAEDGAAAMVIDAKGSNAGVLRTETEQLTAVVTAVNIATHQVTLQFADNSSRTLSVRKDVAISAADIGRQVMIKITHAMAVTVEKR
jgi:hypothetical protein